MAASGEGRGGERAGGARTAAARLRGRWAVVSHPGQKGVLRGSGVCKVTDSGNRRDEKKIQSADIFLLNLQLDLHITHSDYCGI